MNRHALIIENNPDDAFFIRRAFRDIPTFTSCYVCRNISEARAYLKGVGMYADRQRYPKPHAIISDYRLPDGTGADFFRSVQTEKLIDDNVPFCFLSGSATPEEFERMTSLGPSQVFKKPVSFVELSKMLSA